VDKILGDDLNSDRQVQMRSSCAMSCLGCRASEMRLRATSTSTASTTR